MGMDCILKNRKLLTLISLFAFCLLLTIKHVQAVVGGLFDWSGLIVIVVIVFIVVLIIIALIIWVVLSHIKTTEARKEARKTFCSNCGAKIKSRKSRICKQCGYILL